MLIQEAAHSLSAYRRNKSLILLKLDLKKAFDLVSWTSLRTVLLFMQFPAIWINWIMAIVSSSNLTCLVNGSHSSWFQSRRGQGDPLSPSLFLLLLQSFSSLMKLFTDSGRILPFNIGSWSFSHALFANDIIIAVRATRRSCANLNRLLDAIDGS